MSIYLLILFFICLNISAFFLIKHYRVGKKESVVIVSLSVIACIAWIIVLGMSAYMFFVSRSGNLPYIWAILVATGFICTLSVVLIKLIGMYKQ